jgi:hypothetical protein
MLSSSCISFGLLTVILAINSLFDFYLGFCFFSFSAFTSAFLFPFSFDHDFTWLFVLAFLFPFDFHFPLSFRLSSWVCSALSTFILAFLCLFCFPLSLTLAYRLQYNYICAQKLAIPLNCFKRFHLHYNDNHQKGVVDFRIHLRVR